MTDKIISDNHRVSSEAFHLEDENVFGETSQSYWQQTRAQFLKNRLAMISLAVVFFITTVGVFCPFIANKRPIFIKMVTEDAYDENYFIVLDSVTQLISMDDSAYSNADLTGILEESFALMEESLVPEAGSELQNYSQQFLEFGKNPTPDKVDAIDELLLEFEERFDLYNVTLRPVVRYPLFPTLSFAERFFIILYILLLGSLLLRPLLPSFIARLFASIVLSLLAAWIWVTVQPQVQDEFQYRNLIESPEFVEFGGEVLRTPIPYGENENITSESRQEPAWFLKDEKKVESQHFHLFGTDTNGRDVLTRMVYGARISMLIGIVAVSIFVSIGIILGAIAGFFRGWLDILLSRLIEIVICFPVLILILAVQAFLKPSILNIMVALGLVGWTGVARLQRGEFLRLVNQEFVLSARSVGATNLRLIFLHILPNGLGPILVLTSFGIAGSILVESALSFLGFGVPPPMASWGDLLNNGRDDIQGLWWLTVFPGLAIFITVTCFNLVGEGVRDALDPRREE